MIRRILKWSGIVFGAVLVLAVVAVGVIYAASELVLRRTYDVPLTAFTAPRDAAGVEEGRRLATIRGCMGCHGERLEGRVLDEQLLLGRLVAPNLTRVVREYSDAELERAIRHGVRKDGTSVLFMPSGMYYHLSDADLRAILAYLRSAPAVENEPPSTVLRVPARLMLLRMEAPFEAQRIDHDAPRIPRGDPAREPLVFGRYLAITSCTECHGDDLRGGRNNPDLRIAAAYSPEAFRHLLRTGVALGDRELRLMSEMSRRRFRHMTTAEMLALHAYLRTLADAETTSGGRP